MLDTLGHSLSTGKLGMLQNQARVSLNIHGDQPHDRWQRARFAEWEAGVRTVQPQNRQSTAKVESQDPLMSPTWLERVSDGGGFKI